MDPQIKYFHTACVTDTRLSGAAPRRGGVASANFGFTSMLQ